MLVTTRIRRAWDQLLQAHCGVVPGSDEWVDATQRWLRDVAPAVARPAEEILAKSFGVQHFLRLSAKTAPLSTTAIDALTAAAVSSASRSPQAFANLVSDLAYSMGVFSNNAETCEMCQYTLELWHSNGTPIWLCGLDHPWSLALAPWSGDPTSLAPAPRSIVIGAGFGPSLALSTFPEEAG